MARKDFTYQRVGVLGYGLTGKAVSSYLMNHCQKVIVYCNKAQEDYGNIEFELDHSFENLNIDFLVLSPGIARTHPLVLRCLELSIEVISEIELSAKNCSRPIIAVTGTNGKTTTVSVLTQAMERAGQRVGLCGNIGTPFISLIENQDEFDFFIVEVSSFQLESCKSFRPKISVLLNCQLSHEERYSSLDEYFRAKIKIAQSQKSDDFFICHQSLESKLFGIEAKTFFINDDSSIKLENTDDLKLKGVHNWQNIQFCLKIFEILKIGNKSLDKDLFHQGIVSFEPLAHRMQQVRKNIINDSKSTNFFSTLEAVKSFTGQKVFLVMGGQIRDEMDEQKRTVLRDILEKVELVYVFGEAKKEIRGDKVVHLNNLGDLKDHLEGVLLFSPGYPSFDQFKNYEERGNYFKSIFS